MASDSPKRTHLVSKVIMSTLMSSQSLWVWISEPRMMQVSWSSRMLSIESTEDSCLNKRVTLKKEG